MKDGMEHVVSQTAADAMPGDSWKASADKAIPIVQGKGMTC
jgi:hypothetical protein